MINVTINRTAILLLGQIEGRHEKGSTEDDMIGWHN